MSVFHNVRKMSDEDLRGALRGYCLKHDSPDGVDPVDTMGAEILFSEWLARRASGDRVTVGESFARLMRAYQLYEESR